MTCRADIEEMAAPAICQPGCAHQTHPWVIGTRHDHARKTEMLGRDDVGDLEFLGVGRRHEHRTCYAVAIIPSSMRSRQTAETVRNDPHMALGAIELLTHRSCPARDLWRAP